MELIAMAMLIVVSLVIFSILIILYRVYIKKTKTMRNSVAELVAQALYLMIMILFLSIVPFDKYTKKIEKNATTITTQEVITRQLVVDGTDTLVISQNSEIDTLSIDVLPDSVNLKSETVHTIFGETFTKKILE